MRKHGLEAPHALSQLTLGLLQASLLTEANQQVISTLYLKGR
ncbi:hypothetical protein [Hymenobacter coccineus]|nr:hypothetical protein [Hymenobacter coccineus]